MSMARFRVVAPMGVTLPIGCVALLSARQIETRAHQIEVVEEAGDGAVVRFTAPASFKRGEVLLFGEDELPKLQAAGFEPDGDATEGHAAAVKASAPPRRGKPKATKD
jgi:class 3 adenylate cyclase